MAEFTPFIDSLLDGKLRIIECVGEGACGKVYRAHHEALDKPVAVKVLTGHQDIHTAQRFTTEARAASQLDHPNTVRIFDFGVDLKSGILYLAMEFLEGKTLEQTLRADGPMEPSRAAWIMSQVCSALAAAHPANIVHRDIKPSNIMLLDKRTEDGALRDFVKVCDFGVAKLVGRGDEGLPRTPALTAAGSIIGTPAYMSPEQVYSDPLDGRSDLYSCGVVLYEMLTGKTLFYGSTVEVMLKHRSEPPPPLPREIVTVEPRMQQILSRALAKNPTERYETARELRDALRELAREPGVPREISVHPTIESSPPASLTPVSLLSADPSILEGPTSAASFAAHGLTLVSAHAAPPPEPVETGVCVLRLGGHTWQNDVDTWRTHIDRPKTLAVIDASVEQDGLAELTDLFDNIMIRPVPLDPFAVGLALSWMQKPQTSGLKHLAVDERTIRAVRVNSTALRTFYLESLLKDARAASVSQTAERNLSILCEEMVMNAIFHAPIDDLGHRLYAHMNRTSRVSVETDEEATLSWVLTDRYVAVSIRDPFGSFTPAEALARIGGNVRKARLNDSRGSAGMGLKLMLRACTHLFLSISPGNWTEVLALVERRPARASGQRTLCVMRPTAPTSRKIGDNLELVEIPGGRVAQLQLLGEINETSDLSSVYDRSGEVALDLQGVTLVNSAGLYNWLRAVERRGSGLKVRLERCSPVTVNVINVSELAESAEIASVVCPYFCSRCSKERQEVVDVASLSRDEIAEGHAPPRACATCGGDVEFDGMVEEYFAFLIYSK